MTQNPIVISICQRLGLPLPTEQPADCLRQLMAFRNERKLHRRKCDFSGKEIISSYSSSAPFPVYQNDIWWSDKWDALQFGREFDFSRPFFEQFAELLSCVPREGTTVFFSENCEFNSHIRESRNCYMNSLIHKCEDSYYGYWLVDCHDVADCLKVRTATLCYECMDCVDLYECIGLQECENCSNCHFSYQLRACENCIGCSDLYKKKNWIFNKPASAEEVQQLKARLFDGTRSSWLRGLEIFKQTFAQARHCAVHNVNLENSSGDHLNNCRNCFNCFDGYGSQDLFNCVSFGDCKDCALSYGIGIPGSELCFMTGVTRGSLDVAFSTNVFMSSGVRYSDSILNCSNTFGCVGMRQAKNCIFNKEYSESQFAALKERIIQHMHSTGEWGKFFPISLSPYPYNESAAQDYYPLSAEQARLLGAGWSEEESAIQVKGSLQLAPDAWLELEQKELLEVYKCESSGKPYRIIPQEFDLLRRLRLPLPRLSPELRHLQRLARRNPRQLFSAQCAASKSKILTSFPPSSVPEVYAPEVWLQAVN